MPVEVHRIEDLYKFSNCLQEYNKLLATRLAFDIHTKIFEVGQYTPSEYAEAIKKLIR